MIELRVAHFVPMLRPSSAVGGCLAQARWLRTHGHQSLIVTTGGEMLDGVREDGHDVLLYENQTGGILQRGRRKLIAQLAQWEPDLLHVHRPEAMARALVVAQKLDLPVVVSVHSSPEGKTADTLRDDRVKLVLVPSEALRAHCCGRLGLNPDRIAVLPYGVDCRRFRSEPQSNPEVLTIGMVGNVDDDGAGFSEVIAALRQLHVAGIPFRARLLGGGVGLDRLRQQAEAAGIGASTMVAEAGLRLAPTFGDLNVFVYPVQKDHNILCVTKAMAASCAVVASAVGGVPELIQDGHNGLLVPQSDVEALAAALTRLTSEPRLVAELGSEARSTIEQECSLDLVGHALHELYRSAVCGGGTFNKTSTEIVNTWRRVRNPSDTEGVS